MTVELIVNLSGLRQRRDSSKRIKSTLTLGTVSASVLCVLHNRPTIQYKFICMYMHNKPLVKYTRGLLSCVY